ncbi:MAG: uracil phosphoribosyltransferase [Chitinophagaceae bacterium]
MVNNLSAQNSLIGEWISEIRDEKIQKDRMRFRRNLERIGEVAAFQISHHLDYTSRQVQTPLGVANCQVLTDQPVLGTILRAGLPLHQGLLNYFDRADNAFVSAYRKHSRDGKFQISLDYISCPSLQGRVLIMSDPMLATGASLVKTLRELTSLGIPRQIHVVAALSSMVGIEYLERNFSDLTIWTGDIDEELTARGYIVPGLGDAGDLAFGNKKQQ